MGYSIWINLAIQIVDSCVNEVLVRSSNICGWQTCEGGHMILSAYDGNTCVCQKDPRMLITSAINGAWNLVHDGWKGHLFLEIDPKDTTRFTGMYRSLDDWIEKKVSGTVLTLFNDKIPDALHAGDDCFLALTLISRQRLITLN